jgi:hypothetical protein
VHFTRGNVYLFSRRGEHWYLSWHLCYMELFCENPAHLHLFMQETDGLIAKIMETLITLKDV